MHERHGATVGGQQTRLYRIWRGMVQRCENPNADAFPRYGGRGITVCAQWRKSFPAFQAWARSAGYCDSKSIDRIRRNEGYEPGNCRWATDNRQARNKDPARNAVLVEHQGLSLPLSEWAKRLRINYTTLYRRHERGERADRLFRQTRVYNELKALAVQQTGNGKAKLTDGQIAEILESAETGAALARRMHVAESTISMIRSKQRRDRQAAQAPRAAAAPSHGRTARSSGCSNARVCRAPGAAAH